MPEIEIHYNIYDGILLFSKWLVVKNTTNKTVRVNRFVAEELRFAELKISTGVVPTQCWLINRMSKPIMLGSNMSPYYDNVAVMGGARSGPSQCR